MEHAWWTTSGTTYAQWCIEATAGRLANNGVMGQAHPHGGFPSIPCLQEAGRTRCRAVQGAWRNGHRLADRGPSTRPSSRWTADGCNPNWRLISGEEARRENERGSKTYLGDRDFAIFEAVCVKAWDRRDLRHQCREAAKAKALARSAKPKSGLGHCPPPPWPIGTAEGR